MSNRSSRLAALPTLAACLLVLAAVFGVGVPPVAGSSAGGASTVGAPLRSSTETAGGAWAVLPMGLLSDPSNTFWQVLHTEPGSSHWSVVTPQGVADNGGLVAGASTSSAIVGTLPSESLTFSPLSVSVDNGSSWSPAFLPGAVAARPDALADAGGTSGGSLAVVGTRVLRAGQGASSWSPLVTLRRLRRVSPRCDATALDAVAATSTGSPLIATGCERGGTVAVFTTSGGSWRQVGPTLPRFAAWSTSVLRLESDGPATTALVAAAHGGQAVVVALWRGAAGWTASAPLPVASDTPLLASSVGVAGTVAVLVGPKRAPVGYDLLPGGRWTRLPPLPPATSALGPLEPGVGVGGGLMIDAFTVSGGTVLGVYALTPSGTAWAKVQSTEVPLAYGSSG